MDIDERYIDRRVICVDARPLQRLFLVLTVHNEHEDRSPLLLHPAAQFFQLRTELADAHAGLLSMMARRSSISSCRPAITASRAG